MIEIKPNLDFKSLSNIKSSFSFVKTLTIVFFILCTVVVGYSTYSSYSFAEAQRQRIYVLDKGKSLMLALSQDIQANRPVEAREHSKRFHEYMFTLAPDAKGIEANVNKALVMGDKTVASFYKSLTEKGFYKDIMANDVIYRIEVDSVNIDFDYYPYRCYTYCSQFIKRLSNTTERSLITECLLEDITKSENNPQGFYITRFRIIENMDKQTTNNTQSQ